MCEEPDRLAQAKNGEQSQNEHRPEADCDLDPQRHLAKEDCTPIHDQQPSEVTPFQVLCINAFKLLR
jgi:hypothetical protein